MEKKIETTMTGYLCLGFEAGVLEVKPSHKDEGATSTLVMRFRV